MTGKTSGMAGKLPGRPKKQMNDRIRWIPVIGSANPVVFALNPVIQLNKKKRLPICGKPLCALFQQADHFQAV